MGWRKRTCRFLCFLLANVLIIIFYVILSLHKAPDSYPSFSPGLVRSELAFVPQIASCCVGLDRFQRPLLVNLVDDNDDPGCSPCCCPFYLSPSAAIPMSRKNKTGEVALLGGSISSFALNHFTKRMNRNRNHGTWDRDRACTLSSETNKTERSEKGHDTPELDNCEGLSFIGRILSVVFSLWPENFEKNWCILSALRDLAVLVFFLPIRCSTTMPGFFSRTLSIADCRPENRNRHVLRVKFEFQNSPKRMPVARTIAKQLVSGPICLVCCEEWKQHTEHRVIQCIRWLFRSWRRRTLSDAATDHRPGGRILLMVRETGPTKSRADVKDAALNRVRRTIEH